MARGTGFWQNDRGALVGLVREQGADFALLWQHGPHRTRALRIRAREMEQQSQEVPPRKKV